jgi:putative transposase
MKRAKSMELRQLCRLGQVSRAGFYRWRKRPGKPADADLEVRDAIQRVALEFPYGSRPVGFELERRGYTVNRKRVQRLMPEDNLLCLRRRKFIVTTDSNHNLPVYANLAATLVVTRVNQLWVADITYIRLEVEFVYLAVILDAFSRREIGWTLDRTLEVSLSLEALRMALRRRRPATGLVHHSDQAYSLVSAEGSTSSATLSRTL